MNKLQELNEIKKMRNQLVDIMNVYSKDLKDLFFDLYNYTPTPSYDIEIPEDKLTKLHTINFMLKILKRIDNAFVINRLGIIVCTRSESTCNAGL